MYTILSILAIALIFGTGIWGFVIAVVLGIALVLGMEDLKDDENSSK